MQDLMLFLHINSDHFEGSKFAWPVFCGYVPASSAVDNFILDLMRHDYCT